MNLPLPPLPSLQSCISSSYDSKKYSILTTSNFAFIYQFLDHDSINHRPSLVLRVDATTSVQTWSSDGKAYVLAYQNTVSTFVESKLYRKLSNHTHVISCVAISSEPYHLAIGSLRGGVQFVSNDKKKPTITLLQSFSIANVRFSHDDALLAVASLDGHVGVWRTLNLLNGSARAEWHDALEDKSGTRVTDISFSPSSTFLAIACWSGSVYLYHVKRSYQRLCILYRDRVSDPVHAIVSTTLLSSSLLSNSTSTSLPSLDSTGSLRGGTYVLFSKNERQIFISFDDRIVRYDRCRGIDRFRRHVLVSSSSTSIRGICMIDSSVLCYVRDAGV
jgi:WD40 repeat protein